MGVCCWSFLISRYVQGVSKHKNTNSAVTDLANLDEHRLPQQLYEGCDALLNLLQACSA